MSTAFSGLFVLAVVVVLLGGAAVYVSSSLRNEAGRKRLFPVLRPLMRVINPRVVRAVKRRESSYGIVRHVGRRSGVTYQTPVDVARTSEGVLISLPYSPETNWCRNVLAADRCTLTLDGEELALTQPHVLLTAEVQAQLSPEKLRQWEGQGIAHYLSLKLAQGIQSQSPQAAPVAA